MKSREEIRFLTLLSKTHEKAAIVKRKETQDCDKSADINLNEDDWRLPKVIV